MIDETDKIVWRGTVASTPETIAEALRKHAPRAVRIGLEAGQLASWLYHGLKAKGCPVICIDARHARAALSLKVNKTDANDAMGLAQIMRVGWYRKVEVKGHDCQALRALLIARAQIVSQITTLKNCVRGITEGVRPRAAEEAAGTVHCRRAREAIDGDACWRRRSSRCCGPSRRRWSSSMSTTVQCCGTHAATRRFVI